MRFDVITLFPELIQPLLVHGINRRAFEQSVQVVCWNPRDHADGAYRRVDDRPFGGGPGMVMMAEPLARCLAAIRQARAEPADRQAPLVLFSPAGQPLRHAAVQAWATSDGAVLLCGRYEGVDQRFIDAEVNVQISLGDFVLSGGELAAMALLDAVARLQPGVLGDAASHQQDSFNPALDGLLDCPHYTRPEVWWHQGAAHPVPEVLLSGHHQRIERYRRDQRLLTTARCRPDLVAAAQADGTLSAEDRRVLQAAPVPNTPTHPC